MVKHFRSSIGNTSGNVLKTLSEQILNFQVCVVGDPQTLQNKAYSLLRIVLPPVRLVVVLVPFLFWRAPSMEQPELVMKFLTALGAPLMISTRI